MPVPLEVHLAISPGFSQENRRPAEDKVRALADKLVDAALIESELLHRDRYYLPTKLLLDHCTDSAVELREVYSFVLKSEKFRERIRNRDKQKSYCKSRKKNERPQKAETEVEPETESVSE